jgi:YggT family protein
MLENILLSIVEVVLTILLIYKWIIIIASLASWFSTDTSNPIINFLYSITEPLYLYIRRYINTTFANMDLAPIIVIFAIIILEELIKNIIL